MRRFRRRALVRGLVACGVVTALGISAACGQNVAATGTTFTQAWQASWTSSTVVNPFAPNAINARGYVDAPLAYWLQNTGDFDPQVAESWTLDQSTGTASGATLTIKLRKNAQWSDGSDITSQDVELSLRIGYLIGAQISQHIATVETPDPRTVVVKQNELPFNLFERQVLATWIYPAKVWAKLVPDDVQELYQRSQQDTESEATEQLAALTKKLSGFDAKDNYIASGPFTYGRISSNQVQLTKNEHFWAADKIAPEEVQLLSVSGNNQSYAYALSGRVDYLTTYAPPTVVDPFLEKDGNSIVAPDGNYGPGIFFNTSMAPFDRLEVRQAFAHLIDRQQAVDVAYPVGTSSVGAAEATKYLTGLPPADYDAWLTNETTSKLDTYDHDQDKAADLLTAAGLTKSGDKWELDGRPYEVDIACPAGYSDWVAVGENVANQLTKFGIKSSVVTVENNTYFTKAEAGDYPLSIQGIGATDLNPWYAYASLFAHLGLSISADDKVTRAKTTYDWGPVVNVPGVGTVNALELWNDMLITNDEAAQKKAVNTLARAVNADLPMIDLLYNKFYAAFYTTSRWEGWPDASDPLWDPNVPSGTMAILLMEHGLLKSAK